MLRAQQSSLLTSVIMCRKGKLNEFVSELLAYFASWRQNNRNRRLLSAIAPAILAVLQFIYTFTLTSVVFLKVQSNKKELFMFVLFTTNVKFILLLFPVKLMC